jgi:Helix-turn-helix domain
MATAKETAMSEKTKNYPYALRERDAAKFVSASPKTLQRWRYEGRGPIYRREGRMVFYLRNDLIAWLENKTADGGQ